MFKNNKVKDERIVAQQNAVLKNAAVIMFILLSISIFAKSYIFHMDFQYILTDIIIVLVAGLYVTIHESINGNMEMGFKGKNSKSNLLRAIITSAIYGFVLSMSIGIFNWVYYKYNIKMLPSVVLMMFVEFTALSFVVCLILDHTSRKRNEKLED